MQLKDIIAILCSVHWVMGSWAGNDVSECCTRLHCSCPTWVIIELNIAVTSGRNIYKWRMTMPACCFILSIESSILSKSQSWCWFNSIVLLSQLLLVQQFIKLLQTLHSHLCYLWCFPGWRYEAVMLGSSTVHSNIQIISSLVQSGQLSTADTWMQALEVGLGRYWHRVSNSNRYSVVSNSIEYRPILSLYSVSMPSNN